MQRRALKQLGKVTQWTNEKVFSGEKTQLSAEFTQFEKDVEIKKNGIERLFAVSEPFFGQITRRKPTSDPLPPSGSGKDKILYTEAVGLVMIDYGDAVVGGLGDGLAKYGRARCRMAGAQEEFGHRLGEGYMANLEQAQSTVSEYKSLRKKLESRRLALDAAISKLNSNKKGDPQMLEEEVELARMRFGEVEEECVMRGEQISNLEQDQYAGLTDLLEAELEYFSKCKEILEELKGGWPDAPSASTENRPRAKSNASAKSFARGNSKGYSRQSAPAPVSDDDDQVTPNRNRSQSNASSTGKSKRSSMLPSFGSFGKKSGSASKPRKSAGSRMALHSEEEEEEGDQLYSGRNRNRSGSTLSASVSRMSLASSQPPMEAPKFRRTNTAPALLRRYVKAKHDYPGGAHDELPLVVGQVVEIKQVVNEDWYIGESEGISGLFPSSYCEEYTPNPVVPPPMPKRSLPPSTSTSGRNLAPPLSTSGSYRNQTPSPGLGYDHSESEFDSHGFDDGDHYATAAFASAPQSNPISRNHSPGPGLIKKKAPPPPPSRRSQSSSNILAASLPSQSSFLTPPQPAFRQRSNTTLDSSPDLGPGASPFGGSDDEEEFFTADIGSPSVRQGNGIGNGNGNGLGAMHLNRDTDIGMADCGVCGCDDFTQNSFKPKGTCSTCFHSH